MSKNPFDSSSPEWQLFENMKSAWQEGIAFAADVERYTHKAARAREKHELYKAALEKLAPDIMLEVNAS